MDSTYSRIVAITAAIPLMASLCMAQINIGDKLEQKAKQRLERKVDRTIDKGFDKTEDSMDKGAKEATQGKKDKKDTKSAEPESDTATDPAATEPAAKLQTPLRAYSKFDFVPGDQLIAFEDFSQDAIGDFPAKWNTNSSGEIVRIEGAQGQWFKFGGQGIVYPEFLKELPEHFTLEFDVTGLEQNGRCSDLHIQFRTAEGSLLSSNDAGLVKLFLTPRAADKGTTPYVRVKVNDADGAEVLQNDRWLAERSNSLHPPISRVSIQRQKGRLRMYLDEEKIWDLPRAFADAISYRLVLEDVGCVENPIIFSNLRVAIGAPDTRNKLITEGRLVTHGIHFDSGSHQIKPESYGALKEIAAVLNENSGVKVRIIGHTDNDGDQAKNMELSKRRANAVKEALNKEFNVPIARMETDGKGQTEPMGANDSPHGKANNRRVEFVKL